MFYKIVENEYITMIGKSQRVPSNGEEITEAKHTELSEKIKNKPQDTLESVYRLLNETEKYVACERTHEETVDWYVQNVSGGEMTLDEVPTEYQSEVEAKLPTPEVDPYQRGYDQAVLDMLGVE
ncbi:TPA: hypothetical protein KZI03_000605 [Listeria monocytogenes]|nr:hypothetical protein [Listeria monocytogenes]HBI2193245.1 hypothetical protein [Listeria monocytogenes]